MEAIAVLPRDTLQAILDLKAANIHTDPAGREYADKNLIPIKPPAHDPVSVRTLTGFVDLCEAGIIEPFKADTPITPAQTAILISNATSISLITLETDSWRRRTEYLTANCSRDVSKFAYGQFTAPEAFVISLQSQFVPGAGDIDYVLKLASNITAERVVISEDDQVSQRVATRRGVVTKAEQTVKPRVKLAPFRTFREIQQPTSDFLVRIRDGIGEGAMPTLALFEADGGAWELEAMAGIKRWLDDKEAVENIRVIF